MIVMTSLLITVMTFEFFSSSHQWKKEEKNEGAHIFSSSPQWKKEKNEGAQIPHSYSLI